MIKTQFISQQRRSRGFTLVELLVVIAIIGMLAGLMLPAVQQARESGRRAQCINNIRQNGLAVLNYENARNSYPGYAQFANENKLSVAWNAMILAYIEQTTLWEQISQGNLTNEGIVIATFLCPSSGNTTSGAADYVANCGRKDENHFDGVDAENKKSFAVFFDHRTDFLGGKSPGKVDSSYISQNNGTSQTLMLSENLDAGPWTSVAYNGTQPTDHNPGALLYFEAARGFCYACNAHPANCGYDCSQDSPSGDACEHETNGSGPTTGFCRGKGMNAVTQDDPCWVNQKKGQRNQFPLTGGNGHHLSRPSSHHPGIVVTVFCDGSTRPLHDAIDEDIFTQLMMPASGVPIDLKRLL